MALSDAAEHEPPRESQGQLADGAFVPQSEDRMDPGNCYLTALEAQRCTSHYLMHRYNWIRPHQFNDGLLPAVAEEKLSPLSGMG